MSIATMVALGVARSRGDGTRGGEPEHEKSLESMTAKVTAFIPSEINGIYVAGFGILSPDSELMKWLIFAICLALIPLLLWLNYLDHKKRSAATLSVKITLALLIFALVAFVAWAAALPGTPFLALHAHATAFGGFAIVILAVFLPQIAGLLGIVPKGA
jgi:hypothetical protein